MALEPAGSVVEGLHCNVGDRLRRQARVDPLESGLLVAGAF
jgi:hypothetical protein